MSRTKRHRCAACASPAPITKTTFMVDRVELSGEFYLCGQCWFKGENNDAWNDKITRQIIARGSKPVAAIGEDGA